MRSFSRRSDIVREDSMTDLATSLAQARAYAAQSYARNIRIAYANDWKLFTDICGGWDGAAGRKAA
jgi:hypothetical protein